MRAVISGGGRGIGRAIASAIARAGGRAHILDKDAAAVRAVTADSFHNGAITGSVGDVSDAGSVELVRDEALRALGGVDILVNNCGVSGPSGRLEDLEPADWQSCFNINMHGTFLMTRAFLPSLRSSDSDPSIVNIASTAGIHGYPFRTPYASTKWAMVGLTKSLAMELGQGPGSVRCNVICPGSINGERMDHVIAIDAAAKGLSLEEVRREHTRNNMQGTFIDAEDIADAVIFLTSPRARRITGQILPVDGMIYHV